MMHWSSRPGLEQALSALAQKYRTLASLRARREELEGVGRAGFAEEECLARRDQFRAIAHSFPGSLRELDTTSARVLAAKADEVESELAALAEDPSKNELTRAWIGIVLDYHFSLREALAVKLWLARRIPRGASIAPNMVDAFRRWFEPHPHRYRLGPGDIDAEVLGRHLRPPGGRILALVWEVLVARHGRTREDLETIVFGALPLGR